MMAFVTAHATLIALLWPAVTALASLGYTLAESNPRMHAALSFLAGIGIDLPKIWAALTRMLTGSAVTAAKVAVVAVFMGLAGVSVSACGVFSPSAIPPAADFASCVAVDAIAKKPIEDIVKDCGGDVSAVIAALFSSTDSKVVDTPAMLEAKRTAVAVLLFAPDAGK